MSGGASIRIIVEDASLRAGLDRLAAAAAETGPAMAAIGAQLRAHVDRRFETGQGPGGVPWRPSRRATEQRGQTLVDRGLLRQSITWRAAARAVEIGTNMRYAATHQFGATIRPRKAQALVFRLPGGGWRRLRRVVIPARPFLGLDGEDREEIAHILRAHLARALRAGGAGGEAPA